MSIDAVVYPLPGDVNSTAVITPVNSPSSATVTSTAMVDGAAPAGSQMN